jgi:hypothetical protein
LLIFVFGVFIILHGLVHLLYFGQSRRLFLLHPDMDWPDDSWAFSSFLDYDVIRVLAGIASVVATAGFVVGGLGILLGQAWWRPLVVGSAVFSALLFILFWDGEGRRLANKGGVDVLINVAILFVVLVIQWPDF